MKEALELQEMWTPAVVLAGLLLSLSMDRITRPASIGLSRSLPFWMMHSGLWLVAWSICFGVLARPGFAALAVLTGQFLVTQISNAKYRALREPFIFSDFGIFSQAIKHPRLYLPFLGAGRALLVCLACASAVAIGLSLEQPASSPVISAGWTALAGALLLGASFVFAPSPSLDPARDLASRGLFCSIAQYWVREKTTKPLRDTSLPPVIRRAPEHPNIIAIQSESFFDARRLFPGIRREILQNFDEACAAAIHGRLTVPAWGANTMRPEFAFLTGLNSESLDIHRFNPYRQVARRPVRALPSLLREAGYCTVCLHPHPARFFRRDRAFPNLGFERFVDDSDFKQAKKVGPYISDEAVTDKLLEELGRTKRPSFCFVITMENHGPLHLESVLPEEGEEFYHEAPPADCEDLTIYLRHLRNADRQIGRLRHELAQHGRPTILCFYGEHLPSMPKVYDRLGLPDGRTDYFLLGTQASISGTTDLRVEELGTMLLKS
jgi:hypothetical protein